MDVVNQVVHPHA
ncbi:hypothetical protein D018_0216A, partial [Vibrio parahaemolyticus VP2007-007]